MSARTIEEVTRYKRREGMVNAGDGFWREPGNTHTNDLAPDRLFEERHGLPESRTRMKRAHVRTFQWNTRTCTYTPSFRR